MLVRVQARPVARAVPGEVRALRVRSFRIGKTPSWWMGTRPPKASNLPLEALPARCPRLMPPDPAQPSAAGQLEASHLPVAASSGGSRPTRAKVVKATRPATPAVADQAEDHGGLRSVR